MNVEEQWAQLVELKPRYAALVVAIQEGDNTLYLLSKKFGTFSVHGMLKELVGMGLLQVSDAATSGRVKKVYSVTALGKKLVV